MSIGRYTRSFESFHCPFGTRSVSVWNHSFCTLHLLSCVSHYCTVLSYTKSLSSVISEWHLGWLPSYNTWHDRSWLLDDTNGCTTISAPNLISPHCFYLSCNTCSVVQPVLISHFSYSSLYWFVQLLVVLVLKNYSDLKIRKHVYFLFQK